MNAGTLHDDILLSVRPAHDGGSVGSHPLQSHTPEPHCRHHAGVQRHRQFVGMVTTSERSEDTQSVHHWCRSGVAGTNLRVFETLWLKMCTSCEMLVSSGSVFGGVSLATENMQEALPLKAVSTQTQIYSLDAPPHLNFERWAFKFGTGQEWGMRKKRKMGPGVFFPCVLYFPWVILR